jgi:hypothetical protein
VDFAQQKREWKGEGPCKEERKRKRRKGGKEGRCMGYQREEMKRAD